MQSKNDECFKTWLRQKNSQKRKEREAERQRIERESTQELKTEAERRKAFNDWLKNKERSLRTEQRKKKQLEREALATELENISSRSKEASAQETQNSESKKLSFLDEIVRKSEEETGATKNLQTDKTPGGETKEGGEMEESQEHQKNSTEKETEVDDSVHSDENEHQLVNDFSTFGLTWLLELLIFELKILFKDYWVSKKTLHPKCFELWGRLILVNETSKRSPSVQFWSLVVKQHWMFCYENW